MLFLLVMRELLRETIPGAASDSSARDPPPRCHPGTRLSILKRCLDFIATCNGTKKIRWVVGAAGVGKSAIMQNVAESQKLLVMLQASVFFSFNGRNDGTKAVITLAYQLAAKSEPYRLLIEREIDRDPSLLQSSISVQFKKLLIEPFIHNPSLNSAGRVLIIIDGLDECNNPRTQQELLRIISDSCITYPSSPIVWLIASRAEPHIASFFSRRKVLPTYEKEEIAVDSDEARVDVERYLRHELTEIKEASDSLDPAVNWPEEQDLWKLASASGGLFAYAETVIRYIGDSLVGNPTSQLSDVLNVIDNHPMPDIPREQHPMALLDALYTRILSNVPLKGLMNTRKLLLALASNWGSSMYERESNFTVLCNWLAMTPDEAYAAINHLRSVLRVPKRDRAHQEVLKPFHKSFIDYVSDFTRSDFSRDIKDEAQQLTTQCAFRILEEAPDGVDFGDAHYALAHGRVMRGLGTGDMISLSWLIDEKDGWNNDGTRLSVYKLALGKVGDGMKNGDPTFQTEFCIRLLTTRFEVYRRFPHYELRDLVFVSLSRPIFFLACEAETICKAKSRRDEFMTNGILKQTPLKVINLSSIFNQVKLQFRRSVAPHSSFSDPWNSSCNVSGILV